VVIVKEDQGCEFFFCTDPDATPREIIKAFGDRAGLSRREMPAGNRCFDHFRKMCGLSGVV
jgi:hypothetical protein